jgi:DNA-binding winged helix-turn-helix (wHTH) protein/TolB-like protein
MRNVNRFQAAMREGAHPCYEFGPFVLDTAQHLLLKEGEAVSLTPKTYDALLVLVENRGRMLAKEELMAALWPDSFVEESNLTQQVSMIRRALGESPGQDRYIVTVSGRGYRFAAQVKARFPETGLAVVDRPQPHLLEHPDGVEAPSRLTVEGPESLLTVAPAAPDSNKRPGWAQLLALTLLVGVLGGLGYMVYRRAFRTAPSARPRSLAILPLRNLRQDPNSDFLGFSLADAVITKLDYVSSLAVRPSSAVEKYRNQVIDIQQVAADLDVNTLLTGNFIREGDDLRITSQLIDAKTEKILWRRTFDLKYEKLLTVQDDVAQEIIKGLEVNLSPAEVERLRPDVSIHPLAYEYYLRGVDLYSRSEFPLAIKMLEKSAEIDPRYALTWAQLGTSYSAAASFQFGGRELYRKAQAAYERALSLQPAQIDTRVYMANMFTDTGSVERAVPLLREALKTNPNHAGAHWELGYAYRFAGMLNESVTECERARQLDPGVKLNSSAPNSYLYLGQYDKFLRSLPNDNDLAFILFYRGFAEYYKKDWKHAAEDLDRAFELDPSLLQAQIGKALSDAVTHRNRQGLEILHEVENKIKERDVGDPEAIYKIAQAYAMLGDKVSAIRVLRHSIESGFFPYPYFVTDALLDGLRTQPEFTELMALARQRHEAFRKLFFE